MASTTALWFHIETAFAEVDDLCVTARAAQLAVRRSQNEARMAKSFGRGRGGEEDEGEDTDPRFARAAQLAKDLAFREAHPEGADLVELRARLRKRLTWLKARLAEALSDHDVYHALFPIVVYTDELVMGVTRGGASRWEPLQSELYDVANGGELFYSILEDRLREDETHPLIIEIFFFCLSDGFLGMFQSDPKKIDEYKARLAERIRLNPTGVVEANEPSLVELVRFPWQYYAIAASAVVLGYLLLSWLGSSAA